MSLQERIVEVVEHIRGMWRYRWHAVGVAWLLSLVGWLYVYSLPDIYAASTKVFVDTNSLLRPLMRNLTASSDTISDVQLVSRVVLTRPNLQDVAYKTDLALRARTPEEFERLITRLQDAIDVSGGRDNIFTIRYEDFDRQMAERVVDALLATFIEGAIGKEGIDAEVTERAIANEITIHEQRLRAAEEALARFKQENLGYMPDELGDYYQRLQTALALVSETQEKIRLATERRDELERQLVGEEPVFGIMPSSAAGAMRCSQRSRISELEGQLSRLRVDFTDRHPRVVSLQEAIDQLERECAAEAASLPLAADLAESQRLETNPVYQNIRIQLSNTEIELVELRARLAAEQADVERLQRDVDKITQVEADLKQLNRDYEVVQARHQELLRRWEDLQSKKRLDPVTENVQYQTIEPPFAPVEPVGPNRPLLLGAVFVFAVGAGVALSFGLNHVSPTFFSPQGLRRAIELPVLGSVSAILTDEQALRRRVGLVGWAVVSMALVVGTAAAIVVAPRASVLVRSLLDGGIA